MKSMVHIWPSLLVARRGLFHTHKPFVGSWKDGGEFVIIWLMRKVFPVEEGPMVVTRDIGGVRLRMRSTAFACKTIWPKELIEINWM